MDGKLKVDLVIKLIDCFGGVPNVVWELETDVNNRQDF